MKVKNRNIKNVFNKIKRSGNKPPEKLNIATSQASVPIYGLHEKYGFIESYPGCYVKSYLIGDNNYLTAPEEEQEIDYQGYRRLLNSFGTNTEFQLTINNKSVNMQAFREMALLREVGDDFDILRKDMNDVIESRMREGKNGIVKEKYLTVSVHAQAPKKAYEIFQRLDGDIDSTLQKIGSSAKPLSLEETLDILYSIYNDNDEHLIQKTRVVDADGHTHETKSFDYENMRSMGLDITDVLAPSSIEIMRSSIRLGNKFARVLRVNQLPSQLSDEFLGNVTDMGFNCLTTLNLHPISPKEADAIVAKNLTLIRDEKTRAMKAGQKQGIYDDSFVDTKLLDREAEALALMEAMHSRDEKLFETSLTVVVFADNETKLDEYTDTIITEYKKASVNITTMIGQQEEGFNSTLPLCYNQIIEKRTLTSSSAAIFIPFSTLEVMDGNGINYSCNLITRNLILFDRLSGNNFNSFILGTPGSGKSFTAKIEALNVFLKTNADIIIIDPEDEYGPLAKMLKGEIIRIVDGGSVHINPLEIVSNYELNEEENPINAKSDFVLKIMECILNSPFGINSIQKTIIDECVHELYRPFEKDGKLREIPPEQMPTLTDLQLLFAKRHEPEARELAIALKLYSGEGSLNAFGSRTNVQVENRFTVFQIRDIGDNMKPLAMLTILDHVWNKIVENRKIGRNTYFYVDEIYLLFQQEYSASFLNVLFRRARKYGGVPTGITQNVSTLLESPTARDMLQNSAMLQILAQGAPDREKLQQLLNLSDQQLSYITNAPKGQGLMYFGGKGVIPFGGAPFPKGTMLYRALTSDMKEIRAYELQEEREKAKKDKAEKNIEIDMGV